MIEEKERKRILKSTIQTMQNNQIQIQKLSEEVIFWKNKYIEKDKEAHRYQFNIKNTKEYLLLLDKYEKLEKKYNYIKDIENKYNDMIGFFNENNIRNEKHLKELLNEVFLNKNKNTENNYLKDKNWESYINYLNDIKNYEYNYYEKTIFDYTNVILKKYDYIKKKEKNKKYKQFR